MDPGRSVECWFWSGIELWNMCHNGFCGRMPGVVHVCDV